MKKDVKFNGLTIKLKIMKRLFAFRIKTVWELIKYIKPLYELIAAIVKIIKNDKKDEEELKN